MINIRRHDTGFIVYSSDSSTWDVLEDKNIFKFYSSIYKNGKLLAIERSFVLPKGTKPTISNANKYVRSLLKK